MVLVMGDVVSLAAFDSGGLFVEIPEGVGEGVSEEFARVARWDCTPLDLRADDERSLKAFCEKFGLSVSRVSQIRKDDTYLRLRRRLAQDHGLLNHQCFQVLEVLYEKCLSGDVSAIKEWSRVYPDEMKAIASRSALPASTLAGNSEIPEALEDLELSELERLLEQMD